MALPQTKPTSRVAAFLREAGFAPIPRWWIRRHQLNIVAQMAKECEAEVNAIRRAAYEDQGERNPKPEHLSKTARLEHELAEAKKALAEGDSAKAKELQAAIDRMWHVVNDKMLSDDDKLDILYGELHRSKSNG